MAATPTVSEAALWCGGRYHGPDLPLCRTWRNDSREVCPGDGFVALKGENTDGHLYVNKAAAMGASVILVDGAHAAGLGLDGGDFTGISVIVAEDTAKALPQIASGYLEAVAPTLIGITGSVGKTTTRELLTVVLKTKYRVHSAIRSFNTLVGCCLTVLAMPPDTEFLVLEFGTNHFGEIAELTGYFPPQLAMITEVAPAHLEGFGDLGGVLRAKMEICGSAKLQAVVYNADNELLRAAVEESCKEAERIGVGRSECAVRIRDVVLDLDDGGAKLSASYELNGEEVAASAALFGAQHAYNIGCALATGRYFGVDMQLATKALSEFRQLSGRGILKRAGKSSWLVDEAYNASPKAMAAAIANVATMAKGRSYELFAVLGGMRELGESSAYWHNETAASLGCFKQVLLYGGEWMDEGVVLPENAFYCGRMEGLVERVLALEPGSALVLVKGSNSYGLKRIVTLLTEGTYVLS